MDSLSSYFLHSLSSKRNSLLVKPLTGEALDCLVSIQVRLGRDDGEVLGLLKRVLMIQEKEFGSSAEELIITLQKIVHFLEKLEMKDEKFKFRRRLALLRERYKQSLSV